jgi:hypothetical protein
LKLTIKPLQDGKRIATTSLKTCPLCFIWDRWWSYTKKTVLERDSSPAEESDYSTVGVLAAELCTLTLPEKDSKEFKTFKVKMTGNQYGEAYHVLICCLLARSTGLPDLEVYKVVEGSAQNTEIMDLFKWYKVAEPGNPGLLITGKHETTRLVAAAFRGAGAGDQERVFKYIRKSLDCLAPRKPAVINSKYYSASYAAKYWLNRYFRLTEQSSQKQKLLALPKKGDVGRLAVIHLRRNPATPLGRIMDMTNLFQCLRAIVAANDLCATSATERIRATAFSHTILYGDFGYAEGLELVGLCENKFTGKKLPKLYFISRPWYVKGDETYKTENETLKKKHEAVFQLWSTFRHPKLDGLLDQKLDGLPDQRFDGLPVQVKILGIFSVLADRYGEKVCLIGHRSGFVESAGMIGLPIFYLNNEQLDLPLAEKTDGSKRENETYSWIEGDTLWNSAALTKPWNNRLRECSDVMNTFIPVEGLVGTPTDSKNPVVVKDPKKPKDSKEKDSNVVEDQGILHLDKTGKLHLLCLLFMYMNCESEDTTPFWKKRVQMMRDVDGRKLLKERFDFVNGQTGKLKYLIG